MAQRFGTVSVMTYVYQSLMIEPFKMFVETYRRASPCLTTGTERSGADPILAGLTIRESS
jgi:hypothetical protein